MSLLILHLLYPLSFGMLYCLFLFVPRYFSIFPFDFFFDPLVIQSLFFNTHTFVNFTVFPLLLISNFILLCLEKILGIICLLKYKIYGLTCDLSWGRFCARGRIYILLL